MVRPCHAQEALRSLVWKSKRQAVVDDEEVAHVPSPRGLWIHDLVALAEIELCGELIIAASAATGDRLSADRIDEVLQVDRSEGSQHLVAAVRPWC